MIFSQLNKMTDFLQNKNLGFKDEAIAAASKSCSSTHKHGALLIRNGQIISSGCNDDHRHAEHNAVLSGYRLLCGSKERKER